jgi:hypothetical protein
MVFYRPNSPVVELPVPKSKAACTKQGLLWRSKSAPLVALARSIGERAGLYPTTLKSRALKLASSNLDHNRQNHRPPPQALPDELADRLVEILLDQVGLAVAGFSGLVKLIFD